MPETNKELGKGGAEMVSIEKPDIQELVRALEKLDKISLLLIDSGKAFSGKAEYGKGKLAE